MQAVVEGRPPEGDGWRPPDPASLPLQWRVATSTLDEFVLDHDPLAVIRELVQNEYDAEGRSLEIHFLEDRLEVVGSGQPIDQDGWRRLSVMLGTGRVPNSSERIRPKENSLGSKNFGLKSLFLIGDSIFIRSAGQQTLIDRSQGAAEKPFPDPTSQDLVGIRITVPYRRKRDGPFPAFDVPSEAATLDAISRRLGSILLRLANPKGVHSLNRVTVRSGRLGRELQWIQEASTLKLGGEASTVIDRHVRLRARPELPDGPLAIREIEFQQTLRPASGLRPHMLPSYFHRPGGRIAIGIGFRMRNRVLDADHVGTIYYPLEADLSHTGCAVNANAPFVMNSDRSQLEAAASEWNSWLLDSAARASVKLLPGLYEKYGPSAFAVWQRKPSAANVAFIARIQAELKEKAVWPVKLAGAKRRRLFETARQLAIPETGQLVPLLPDRYALDPQLTKSSAAVELAKASGCRSFSINAAVHLRCGNTPGKTKVSTENELALHYPDFPRPLRKLDLQLQFARALDSARRLGPENLTDLRSSATTLTAAAALAPAEDLYAIDEQTAAVASLPAEERLHPRLLSSRIFRTRLAKRFSLQEWVSSAAARASNGEASESERQALYRFLLDRPRLSSKTWGRLRRAPVVLDSVGNWANGDTILLPETGIPKTLAGAFHLARPEYAKDLVLATRLGFQKKLRGRDLVLCAQRIGSVQESREFQALLKKYRRLLARPLVRELSEHRFLPETEGHLGSPAELYVPNQLNRSVLGDSVPYVAGSETTLYKTLGCRAEPDGPAIVNHLAVLRAHGSAVTQWDDTYKALVAALERERRSTRALGDEPILELGGRWWRPRQVLVGRHHARTFLDLLPVVAAGRIGDLVLQLGGARLPTAEHWTALFEGISARNSGANQLNRADVQALRSAYGALSAPPDGLPITTRYLLDDDSRIHEPADAGRSRFLINDDPPAANAIKSAGLPIAFADEAEPKARAFFRAAGARTLTENYRQTAVLIGPARKALSWLADLVSLLHKPYLATVTAKLVSAEDERPPNVGDLRRKLRAISELALVESVSRSLSIGHRTVAVPASYALEPERICLTGVRTKPDAIGLLADVIATMAHPSVAVRRSIADSLYRVLSCPNDAAVAQYLLSRGIKLDAISIEDDGDGESDDEALQDLLGDFFDKDSVSQKRGKQHPATTGGQSSAGTKSEQKPDERTHEPLPPIEDVGMEELPPGDWTPPDRKPSGSSSSTGGGGAGRSEWNEAQDRDLGRRGEELVYRHEQKRVLGYAFPVEKVVWVSKADELADHDIASVDPDGERIYLEVKTTAGRHGRFVWPIGEFDKALAERKRYILWRVYEGRSKSPKARQFRDPVSLLLGDGMRLDLDRLSAEVEPLRE
jgi:hypothetical protein